MSTTWTVYLSGEIHTDWREQIMQASAAQQLPLRFVSAVTNHGSNTNNGMLRLMPVCVQPWPSPTLRCTTMTLCTP